MDSSPFSKLPAELRDTIWELALYQDSPIEITRAGSKAALTATCKSIRSETLSLFYAINTFRIPEEIDNRLSTFIAEKGICRLQIHTVHESRQQLEQMQRFGRAFANICSIAERHSDLTITALFGLWVGYHRGCLYFPRQYQFSWTMSSNMLTWQELDEALYARHEALDDEDFVEDQFRRHVAASLRDWRIARDRITSGWRVDEETKVVLPGSRDPKDRWWRKYWAAKRGEVISCS